MRLINFIVLTTLLALLAANATVTLATWAAETSIDPCSLLTQADAGGAVNVTSHAPDRRLNGTCVYSSVDALATTKHEPARHTVVVIRQISTVFFGALVRMGAKSIAGLGDAAYSYHDSIYVQKGERIVNIAIFAQPTRKDLDQKELALAKIVVGRM